MLTRPPRHRHHPAKDVLADLDVPDPFDLAEFCRRIERRRGRRLVIEPLPPGQAAGVCGMYVETGGTDHVYYAAESRDMHRDHVIVHELMHLLLDHGRVRTDTRIAVDTAAMFPGLSPELISRVLLRSNYATPDEQEAETLASLIVQGAATRDRPTSAGRLDDLLG